MELDIKTAYDMDGISLLSAYAFLSVGIILTAGAIAVNKKAKQKKPRRNK